MSRIVLCVALLAVWLGHVPVALAQGDTTDDATPPKLQIDAREFNFGEIWQGMTATRKFNVTNIGHSLLTLKVTSTCGCTVTTQPRSPLAPGESSTFTVTYDTKRPGHASKSIIVTTNDPDQEKVIIPVRGEIRPLFTMDVGDRVVFHDLDLDSAVSRTVTLANNHDDPVHLKLPPDQKLRGFVVDLREVKPGHEYALDVRTKPSLHEGWNTVKVELATDFAGAPIYYVSLAAHVPPRFVLTPRKLSVSPQQTQSHEARLRIEYRKADPINVTEIRLNDRKLDWVAEPSSVVGRGELLTAWTVRVRMPGYADTPKGASLYVITNDPTGAHKRTRVPIVKLTK